MIPGYVYLIENTARPGVYKLGRTSGLLSRLASHARRFPMRLVWVVCTNDSNRLEKYVKSLWAARCVGGEWFALTADDMSEFCRTSTVTFPAGERLPRPVAEALVRTARRGRLDFYRFHIGHPPRRSGDA